MVEKILLDVFYEKLRMGSVVKKKAELWPHDGVVVIRSISRQRVALYSIFFASLLLVIKVRVITNELAGGF